MFSDASTLRRAPALVVLIMMAAALLITGCDEEVIVDPYVETTMARVMNGDTLSVDFLFEIDAPALKYAKDDVAIVANGNDHQFLIGPDIEHQYTSWSSAKLGVQKRFSHRVDTPHMFLKRVKNGELITPIDSVETYILPKIFTVSKTQLTTPGAPLPDLDWKRVSRIMEFYPENDGDPLIEVQSVVANFVYALNHDVPEELAANPGPEHYSWYAVFEKSTFKIVDLGIGASWMMDLLTSENLPLIGSFSIASVEDTRVVRGKNHEGLGHVCGTMKVNWFKYANTFVNGSE
jgi:hypothetical protein